MIYKKLSRIIFLVFFALFFYGCDKKEIQEKETVPFVVVTPVVTEMVSKTEDRIGQVVAQDKVQLYARVEGFLNKQCVEDGRLVKKNELLYQIEKTQYQADLQSAEANLENKLAVQLNNKILFERRKKLVVENAVSKEDYDIFECKLRTANADVSDAKAQVELAKLDLSYTNITAPFDGQLGVSTYNVGALVGPGTANTLAINTLVKLDPIRVEFEVPEFEIVDVMENRYSEFGKVENGEITEVFEQIDVGLILSNKTEYSKIGKINFVDNHVDPTTGTVLMRAVFSNPDYILRPGSYVNVHLYTEKKHNALLIPQSAVMREQGGTYVLLVDKESKVKSVNVELGDILGEYIVIKSGLKKGDLIITQGIQKVREGAKVTYKTVIPNSSGKNKHSVSSVKKNNLEKTVSKGSKLVKTSNE